MAALLTFLFIWISVPIIGLGALAGLAIGWITIGHLLVRSGWIWLFVALFVLVAI